MKQSEIIVSLPMTSYNELNNYKEKYYSLVDELKSCLDTRLVDSKVSQEIHLDLKKMIDISKKYISTKYINNPISIDN